MNLPHKILMSILLLCACVMAGAAEHHSEWRKRGGEGVDLASMPESSLRRQLGRLETGAQKRAFAKLKKYHLNKHDLEDHIVDADGNGVRIVCAFEVPDAGETVFVPMAESAFSATSAVPISSPPAFHSKLGSPHVIYLDFNGHTLINTGWNYAATPVSGGPIVCKPYGLDGDVTTFSAAEQTAIFHMWQQVAEDYAPFDVDVTTEEPTDWTRHTARALITQTVVVTGVGGIAYREVMGSFSYDSTQNTKYGPALVFPSALGNNEKNIAEAISHEIGHNMGLSHDGTTSQYYSGHSGTSGETSWAPIMGVGYSRNVVQWSKGEYTGANNSEDDLDVIAGKCGYRTDDYGDTPATSTVVTAAGGTALDASGRIERNTDVDVVAFVAGAGPATITVNSFSSQLANAGNLDIQLQLLDGSYAVVASAKPTGKTSATLNATLTTGVYYLRIFNDGEPTPPSTGYTTYGSLGQWFLTGTISHDTSLSPMILVQPANVTVNAGNAAVMTISAKGAGPLSYQWKRNGGNVGTNNPNLIINNVQSSQAGSYTCVVTNGSGSVTSSPATLTVVNVAPTIVLQPIRKDVVIGQTVNFSVAAVGTDPISYQWKRGSTNVGINSPILVLSSVQASDAGSYTCVASNSFGTVTSNPVSLTVSDLPNITSQPTSKMVSAGQNWAFSVSANSASALSYEWKRGAIPVGYSQSLSLSNIQSGDAGTFTCIVTNLAGSVTSAPAVLTVVNSIPTITTQAKNTRVNAGKTATIFITATGSNPLSYQWKKGTMNVGINSSTLTIANAQTSDSGPYTCVVTNGYGSVISTPAIISVVDIAPTITTQAVNTAVNTGQTATFTIVAAGTNPLSYQWRRGSTNVGGNNPSLSISNAQGSDAGSYTCLVTNSVGSVTSSPTTLTVNVGPTITIQPCDQSVTMGQSLTFMVAAVGTPSPTYQWKFGGGNIGVNSPILTITNAQASNAGLYTCSVSNVVGSITSSPANLIVHAVGPLITTQPSNNGVNVGQTAVFTIVATGAAPISYQWKSGTTNVGSNSPTLTLTNVQTSDAGWYRCVVTDSLGSATSNLAILTLNVAPKIINQPGDQILSTGQTATFTVTAEGTSPMTYQWKFGATNVGTNSPTLVLSNVQSSNIGLYSCQVTNIAGTVASMPAMLIVKAAPTIMVQPGNQDVAVGANATFSVTATGAAILNYLWFKDAVQYVETNGPILTLTNVQPSDSGNYRCIVSNSAGAAVSQAGVLTLIGTPVITKQPTNQAVNVGLTATFSLIATGDPILHYQWKNLSGNTIVGTNSPTLIIPNVQTSDDGIYQCLVSNGAGSVSSVAVSLKVNVGLTIWTQPTHVAVTAGQNATFIIVATGSGSLSYQWKFGSVNIGTNNSSLTITNAQPSNAGSYTCTVIDGVSSVTSTPAILTVNTSPLQDRIINMEVIPGNIWKADEPANAVTDPPVSSTQAIHVFHDQQTVLSVVPGGPG